MCGLQLEVRADHADGLALMPNRISMGLTALSLCINLALVRLPEQTPWRPLGAPVVN